MNIRKNILFLLWILTSCSYVSFRSDENILPKLSLEQFKEPAEKILSQLSINQKIGQLFIVGFQGVDIYDLEVIERAKALKKGLLGGVVFYAYNIKSPQQCGALNKYFSAHSFKDLPPFLGVDQEGGNICRLCSQKGFLKFRKAHAEISNISNYKNKKGFLSAQEVAETLSLKEAYRYYKYLAQELRQAGFNFNFGPVVDVNFNRDNPIIGKLERSFSDDPKKVALYAQAFIEVHIQEGILTAAKHFPGHSSTQVDSHTELPQIIDSAQQEEELFPYIFLNEKGILLGVITAHILFVKADPYYPATLSEYIIKKLLRGRVGFKGLCITDALDMGALLSMYSMEEILIRAIQAGNSILLISNNPASLGTNPHKRVPIHLSPERCIYIIRKALKEGRLSEEQINAVALKVLEAKLLLNSFSEL